jgi:cyclohexa-1,5-dienecarbonyl-CoA hydratase
MSKIDLRMEQDGQVARVVLNAPKGNILDSEMIRELIAAVGQTEAAPGVKLMVIEGAGSHFSFGASVEEHHAAPCREMIPLFGGLFFALMDAAVPTLAAVRGQCLGGGMELAVFCNWVFAHHDARFGQPEIRLGVLPPVAALLLPLLAGQAASDDICLTGRTLTAHEAMALGLVHTVSEDVEAVWQAWFHERLMPHSAASLRRAVRASRHGLNRAFREQWADIERLYLDDLMATQDANEGIAAFLARRPPVWTHR